MKQSPLISVALFGSLAVFVVAIGARRLASANAQVGAAEASLAAVERDAHTVAELRNQRQRIAEHKRPEGDVNGHVQTVLSSIGLPDAQSVRSDADSAWPTPGGGVKYRRQSFRVELANMTLADFGRFIEAWRRDQPLWAVSRLSFVHESRGASRNTAANQTYLITLTLSAIYVDDSRDT